MAILSVETRLTAVQTLITDILANGQAYRNDGRSFTKADLEALFAQESKLLSQYNAETFGKARNLVKFKDPI